MESFDPGSGNKGVRVFLDNPPMVRLLNINILWDVNALNIVSTIPNPTFAQQGVTPTFNESNNTLGFSASSFTPIDLTGQGVSIAVYDLVYSGEAGMCFNFKPTFGAYFLENCNNFNPNVNPCASTQGDITLVNDLPEQCITSFIISGLIESVGNQCDGSINYGIEDVDVVITENGVEECTSATDNAGVYSCNVSGGNWYEITPSKLNGKSCGLTTFDVLLIQNQILNEEVFTENWQFYAADVNDDWEIKASDVVAINNVLLGNSPPPGSLTYFESWEFFPVVLDFFGNGGFALLPPLTGNTLPPLKSSIQIDNISSNVAFQSFVGIKNGDVNGSCTDCGANFGGGGSTELRENLATLNLSISDRKIEKGELVEIPFSVNGFNQKAVYSYGLEISLKYFDIVNVRGEDFGGSQEFSAVNHENGTFKSVWVILDKPHLSVEDGTTLFTLQLRAKESVSSLKGLIKINESIIENRIYTTPDETPFAFELEIGGIIPSQNQATIFPNPFDSEITLSLDLVNEEDVQVEVFDNLGRNVYSNKQFFSKGNHQLSLSSLSDLPMGIYFCKITTPTWSVSKKIQKVE